MESVEQVSGAVGRGVPDEAPDALPLDAMAETGDGAGAEIDGEEEYRPAAPTAEVAEQPAGEGSTPAEPVTATAPGAGDPWAPLLAAGAQLLGELSAASSGERASPWVQTDATTGQRYLKLPVPDPQTIQRLAEGLLALLGERK